MKITATSFDSPSKCAPNLKVTQMSTQAEAPAENESADLFSTTTNHDVESTYVHGGRNFHV